MYFLDETYFDGNAYTPAFSRDAAVGISRFTQAVNQGNLDWFIAMYEPEYLKKLLGFKLYDKFMEGIEAETPLDKWVTLRDKIFRQISYKERTIKYSPAAEYVLFKNLNRNISQTTTKGQVKSKVYEADNADISQVLPMVWNHMCDESYKIQKFICESGLYEEDILSEKELKDRRAKRCLVCSVGYRASLKFWWRRYSFNEFRHINEFNL